MRQSTLPLLAACLLAGAPLAAETFDGQPCVFQFNNHPRFIQKTSTGALVPFTGLVPEEWLAGVPKATGTPTAASCPCRTSGTRRFRS